MQKFASVEKEYEKNKDLKKEDVQALQEWAGKQPHLPKLTELDAILFLHSCYYSNEAAKKTIDQFYTMRGLCPEFFANRDPRSEEFQKHMALFYFTIPKLTPKGEKVLLARFIKPDPQLYNPANQLKSLDMVSMLSLHQEGTDLGCIVITDWKGVTMAHISNIGFMTLKKIFLYLQEAFPVRLKELHYINVTPVMHKIIAVIEGFIKREAISSIHVHTENYETLYEFVPKECLPKDYGGECATSLELIEKEKENLLQNVDYFLEEEKMVSNESLRPGKPKNPSDLFGAEGSFKKLDVD